MQLQELDAHRHTVTTRSGEISYIDIGTGPAALFVHGISTNAYLWRNVVSGLAGQRRCIAVDLPLHGRSPVTAEQDLSIAALAAGLGDFCDALGLTGIDLTRVVTVDGARLFFPEERPMDLVPYLEQHWAAAAAVRA